MTCISRFGGNIDSWENRLRVEKQEVNFMLFYVTVIINMKITLTRSDIC